MAGRGKLPRLLKINEVAEISGLHERTVRKWITEGYVRAVKRGGWVRIMTDDLLDFLEANCVKPRTGPSVFRRTPLPVDLMSGIPWPERPAEP